MRSESPPNSEPCIPAGELPSVVTLIDGQAYRNTIEAAQFCGLSIAEFHRRVKKYPDRFKPKELGPKCTRFKVSELIAAMDSFTAPVESGASL
jgi:predicted DNA-binding transcriptional regulator AlpA